MTVSFHKFGDYFPGTGDLKDIGYGGGKNYSINVPMLEGMNDESYKSIFEPIMSKVMEHYCPEAIVMVCGADSLAGDRIGCWNLSIAGHTNCVKYMASFCIPMLVLVGGGYTLRNVPRCWVNETAAILQTEISDQLPHNDYFEYFGPDYNLHIPTSNMENRNSAEDLEKIKIQCCELLRNIDSRPSVQIQTGQYSDHPPLYQPAETVPKDPDTKVELPEESVEHPLESSA